MRVFSRLLQVFLLTLHLIEIYDSHLWEVVDAALDTAVSLTSLSFTTSGSIYSTRLATTLMLQASLLFVIQLTLASFSTQVMLIGMMHSAQLLIQLRVDIQNCLLLAFNVEVSILFAILIDIGVLAVSCNR